MVESLPRRRTKSYAACQFVVRVGGEERTVRAASVWPIAEVLGCEDQVDAVLSGAAGVRAVGLESGLMHDLLESSMILPPRPRRKRDRAVSSRAVFFQAAGDSR